MSRLLLAPPGPGEPIPDSRRVSAACSWLYLQSATADGTYRLACSRCGAEWPVQAPTAYALQRAVAQMEANHQEDPSDPRRCRAVAPKPAFTPRKKVVTPRLF